LITRANTSHEDAQPIRYRTRSQHRLTRARGAVCAATRRGSRSRAHVSSALSSFSLSARTHAGSVPHAGARSTLIRLSLCKLPPHPKPRARASRTIAHPVRYQLPHNMYSSAPSTRDAERREWNLSVLTTRPQPHINSWCACLSVLCRRAPVRSPLNLEISPPSRRPLPRNPSSPDATRRDGTAARRTECG